jgi:hypothetical protein
MFAGKLMVANLHSVAPAEVPNAIISIGGIEDVKGAHLALTASASRFANARKLHRPTRVGSTVSPRSSRHVGPLFGEKCSEAANLQRWRDRCHGANPIRKVGLMSNFFQVRQPLTCIGPTYRCAETLT